MDYDVVIAGAGPVGLLLACELRLAGVSVLVLAFVSAVVLQHDGFSSLPGIAIIVACLTANQIAYLIGVSSVNRGRRSLPHDQPNNHPGEHSHNHIAGEYK